jgi:membrane protease YdiL (CAAX protease family)
MLYFLLTLISTWTFFGIAIAAGMASTGFPGMLFHILGGFCPSLVAVIVVLWKFTPEAARDFWHRLSEFRRIRVSWWLITLLLTPALVGLSLLIDVWLGAPRPDLSTLKALLADPASLVFTTVMMIVTGALSEELGWRLCRGASLRFRLH